GGQNEAGPEGGAQLAVVRTREIEDAAAILGAKAWYLNLPDFGFSKSVDETLEKWNHDVALERLVKVIRTVRPQIVITNHNPDGTDHGHHRATGKLLVEAFDAAADPKQFPQQIEKGLKPWSITRIYLRAFAAEGTAFSVDVSKRDALTGLSASEIGAYALSRHFSQGMFRNLRAGERELRHFSVLETQTPVETKVKSLLDGINGAERVDNTPRETGVMYEASTPAALALARKSVDSSSRVHLNRALAAVLGLKVDVRCDDEFITPGETASISVRAANTGMLAVTLKKISFRTTSAGWKQAEATPEKVLGSCDSETVSLDISATENVALSYPPEEHIFEHDTTVADVIAVAEFEFQTGAESKETVIVEAPVPLRVAPRISFTLSSNPLLIFSDPSLANEDKEAAHIKLLATCNMKIKEPVFLAAAIGEKPKEGETGKVLGLNFKGDTAVWTFNQWFSIEKLNAGISLPTHVWDANGFYKTPIVTLRRVALDTPNNMRIGLVKGCDEQLYHALKRMQDAGVARGTFAVELLSDEELITVDLNRFQAIVLDIRTTQQRPVIRKLKERLKAFMTDGGTVVCMYQKDFDWNDRSKDQSTRGAGFFRGVSGGGEIAPFPIELSFDRVTREDAPVTLLKPLHPLMLAPCRLWPKDFDGWAQERGAYFPKKWAEEYVPLLSSMDPGEKALDGGLLIADVGQGAFIYTSYFLQHQFRTGVPGAYRLMANMLSYSRLKRAERK
ncbi:MAG: PIG-L family deacetylase, partial [Planctomycetota bacterium]